MKLLTILFLSSILFLSGCQQSESNVKPVKDTDVVVMTPSPASNQSTTVSDDALKKAVEDNLKEKNITTVTVEVKDGEVTLKGSVPASKYADAMFAATQETKNVKNLVLTK